MMEISKKEYCSHCRIIIRSICCTALILVCSAISAQEFISESLHQLPKLARGSSAWGDYDNDGFMDVVLVGIDQTNSYASALYRNNQDGSFSNVSVGLRPVVDGDVAFADLNRDGYLDIILSGLTSEQKKVCYAYKNNGDDTFTHMASFEGTTFGKVGTGDMNNDGYADIVVTGINDEGDKVCIGYKNTGNYHFVNFGLNLPGISHGGLLIHDFNNDGYIDIIINGVDFQNRRVTDLYLNSKLESWVKKETDITPMRSGDLGVADFNSDGYLDLVVSGNDNAGNDQTRVFRNYLGESFVKMSDLNLVRGSVACGDYNNDGKPDIIVSGIKDEAYVTKAYKKTDGGFEESDISFPGISGGDITWVDFNNDRKLDVFLFGYSVAGIFSDLYENNQSIPNQHPSTPVLAEYNSQRDSVVLTWHPSTDDQTAGDGLTYNVLFELASDEGPSDQMLRSALSSRVGVMQDTFAILTNLEEGLYYWRVEALDPAFGISDVATMGTFMICNDVELGADTIVCPKSEVYLFAGEDEDQVQWFERSSQIGEGQQLLVLVSETTEVVAQVTTSFGCTRMDTIHLVINPNSVIDAGDSLAVCLGDSIRLGGNPTAVGSLLEYQYSWTPTLSLDDPHSANPMAMPTTDTVFTVVVNTVGCVADSAQVKVHVLPLPHIKVGEDQIIGRGAEIILSVQGGISYQWFPQESLLFSKTNAPVAKPEETTEYSVVGTDRYGCINTDSMRVVVQNEFFVPELFSPNEDTMNDNFLVHGFGIQEIHVKVFDQWGTLVYETESVKEATEEGWDGFFHGNKLDSGAYTWIVKGEFTDGLPLQYKGSTSGTVYLRR